MSIRLILTIAICVASISLQSMAQAQSTPPFNQNQPKLPDAKENKIIVFACKHMQASEAQKTLQIFLGSDPGHRVVADVRTNSLLVSGSDEQLKKCEALLQIIDQASVAPTEDAELLDLQREFLKNNKGMISSFAESLGVTFALDEELGLVMLKGKQEEVKKIQKFIEDLKALGKGKSESAIKPVSLAIQVLWLTNSPLPPEVVTEADPKLQPIIDRLGKQGIKNLAVAMQLIARCDPSPGTPGKCKVSGSVDLKDHSQELFVDASFSQLQSAQVFNGHIEIRAARTPVAAGVVSRSSVQVDVNLVPGKYYVLSSTPVGDHHSAFVVHLLDDF